MPRGGGPAHASKEKEEKEVIGKLVGSITN